MPKMSIEESVGWGDRSFRTNYVGCALRTTANYVGCALRTLPYKVARQTNFWVSPETEIKTYYQVQLLGKDCQKGIGSGFLTVFVADCTFPFNS